MQMLRNLQSSHNMPPIQLLLLPRRQQPCNLQNILNLPAIHIQPRQLIELLGSDVVLLR